ncbi:hypothetical protein [Trujillonella humicola]|uniref:hypothetical protein n=1 Tax=Trujillonella humicola TaxID=3383699 RepID=UPI0039065109
MTPGRRCAVALLLCVAPLVLGACGAGQAAQTATSARDHTGGAARVGDLTIRAAQLAYPRDGVRDPGEPVPLTMAVENSGREDDVLVDVRGEPFTGAAMEAAGGQSGIPLPADTTVFVGDGSGDGPTVTLIGLVDPKSSAQSVELTLTFARAGETTVRAITAPAPDTRPRAPAFDFHEDHEADMPGEAP